MSLTSSTKPVTKQDQVLVRDYASTIQGWFRKGKHWDENVKQPEDRLQRALWALPYNEMPQAFVERGVIVVSKITRPNEVLVPRTSQKLFLLSYFVYRNSVNTTPLQDGFWHLIYHTWFLVKDSWQHTLAIALHLFPDKPVKWRMHDIPDKPAKNLRFKELLHNKFLVSWPNWSVQASRITLPPCSINAKWTKSTSDNVEHQHYYSLNIQ